MIPVADRLVWQMASEIRDGDVVATALPLAVLAIALARATHAPRLTYLAPVRDQRRQHHVTLPELFDHARRGRVDTVFFDAAEIDPDGRTNPSALGPLRRWCKRPILVVPRQSRRALVPRVGMRSSTDPRRTTLLTDLGRFSVGPGGAVLEAIAPHASLATITARTGFSFTVANILGTSLLEPPRAALDAIDPDGLRYQLVGGHP